MDYNPVVSMSKYGFRATVRLTAILLLAWTGLDLTVTRLCPADNQGPPIAVDQERPGALAPPASSTSIPQGHVDDCFCCSHCVNVALVLPLRAVAMTTACEPVPDFRVPPGDGCPLYHPPQLS